MSYLCGLQKIEKIQFCRPEDLVDKMKVLLCKNIRRQKDRYGLQHEDFGKNVESAG